MSLESKIEHVLLQSASSVLNKFILVKVKNKSFLRISNGYYGSIEHKAMLHDLMSRFRLKFDYSSKDLLNKNYSITSMGICKLDIQKHEARFFGQSAWYNIGVTKEGAEVIRQLLPDWKIKYEY